MRALIIHLAFAAGLALCLVPAHAQSGTPLSVHYVDPLEKIFRETAFFQEREALAEVVRGEHATLQFALRSDRDIRELTTRIDYLRQGSAQLSDWTVGFVGYVRVGRTTPTPSRDRYLPASGLYPDPILEQDRIGLPAFMTQPVWVSIPIPANAQPGRYEGRITFSGKAGRKSFQVSQPFTVQVYPPVIGRTRLWVTNWFNASPQNLARLNEGKPVAAFSDEYWGFVRLLARKMGDYRQNVAIISPLNLAVYRKQGDQLSIDFSRFDRMVDIFREEGVVGRIEGGHIGGRESHWTSPFVVSVPVVTGDSVRFERLPIADERARAFYRQFIPALVSHLKDKGWYDNYIQHIADEPITENTDSYIAIASFIRELAPGMPIVEACHSRGVNNTVDIWVPQLDFMHKDYAFYKERMADNDEAWFYTCLAPQGEYANRFVELPLIKTRILHWINFRFDIPGYLHWGLNFWNGDPFGETTGIITESGNVLPGGDAWIVYPARNKILSSIRFDAMRDGIVDYELLKMAVEKYPDEVRELARQIVYQFDRYDINVQAFRDKRRKLMEMLSK